MSYTKEQERLGEMALELISEYPLYASTSNVSYEEAIGVAKALYPDINEWQEILDELKGVFNG